MFSLSSIKKKQVQDDKTIYVIAVIYDDIMKIFNEASSSFPSDADDPTIKQFFLDYVDTLNNPPPISDGEPDPTQQKLIDLVQQCLDHCNQLMKINSTLVDIIQNSNITSQKQDILELER